METLAIERLIRISREKPLLPEVFVPWHKTIEAGEVYLPNQFISLHGLPAYDKLNEVQKQELARHEVVQVMYSYAWSESLFCLFMNRYLLTLTPDHIEHRFLLRELIEEFRHQDMFSMAIEKLEGKPIPAGWHHRFWGRITVKFMPHSWVFISALAVEQIADIYGKEMRRDPQVYSVLQKVSELHHIEEGRHIYFTENLLKRYTDKAGILKRSWYSCIMALNIHFMRTLYVKQEIFERIGAENPGKLYKAARKHYHRKFSEVCLESAIDYVKSFNGFNRFTRFFWRALLEAPV
jgi:hypothetical protein